MKEMNRNENIIKKNKSASQKETIQSVWKDLKRWKKRYPEELLLRLLWDSNEVPEAWLEASEKMSLRLSSSALSR